AGFEEFPGQQGAQAERGQPLSDAIDAGHQGELGVVVMVGHRGLLGLVGPAFQVPPFRGREVSRGCRTTHGFVLKVSRRWRGYIQIQTDRLMSRSRDWSWRTGALDSACREASTTMPSGFGQFSTSTATPLPSGSDVVTAPRVAGP